MSLFKRLLMLAFTSSAYIFYVCFVLNYSFESGIIRTTNESEHRSGYLVNTVGCKILDMDPFHPSVIPFLKNKSLKKCPPSLIIIENEVLVYNKSHPSYKRSNCCFSEIHRVTQNLKNYTEDADQTVRIESTCNPISKLNNYTIPTSEFLQVSCEEMVDENITKTIDFLASIFSPEKHSSETRSKAAYWKQRHKYESEEKLTSQKPPNVLILGLDSISRLNLIRSLPKLKIYLESRDFVEMKGYTKIGQNTNPNMMAALGGMTTMKHDEYPCIGRQLMYDHCPLIWKNYSFNHYITALMEDAPDSAMFNYFRTGFVEQPVDYYFRTIALALSQAKAKNNCQNGMTETEFLVNYLRNFVRKISNSDAPYFLLSWFTSLAHSDSNDLKPAETIFYKILSDLVDDGSYHGNNTIIFFISDHGMRIGEFRETFLGYYEESLPFFFMRLPPFLKLSHPDWYANLKKSSHRLTTPLDFHATLEHILSLSNNSLKIRSKGKPLYRTAYSFFEEIPVNRTCQSSGIPEIYCRCWENSSITIKSEKFKEFGNVIVAQVNNILLQSQHRNNCIAHTFHKLLYARTLSDGKVLNNFNKLINFTDHVIGIEVNPSKARFEATIRVFSNKTVVTMGDISRINRYAGQRDCVKDNFLRIYCYC